MLENFFLQSYNPVEIHLEIVSGSHDLFKRGETSAA